MKHYGVQIAEGTSVKNLTIPNGQSFPQDGNIGELFYLTVDIQNFSAGLYVNDGTAWKIVAYAEAPIETFHEIISGVTDRHGEVSFNFTAQQHQNFQIVWIDVLILNSSTNFMTQITINPDQLSGFVTLSMLSPTFTTDENGQIIFNPNSISTAGAGQTISLKVTFSPRLSI